MEDTEAWLTSVHEVIKFRHDLVTKKQITATLKKKVFIEVIIRYIHTITLISFTS